MNITERSSKADIIDAACELTGNQAARIAQLEQQQAALFGLLAVASVLMLLF